MDMRSLAEQYRTEAETIAGVIDKLRGGAKPFEMDTEMCKKIDMLGIIRRENLATYRHLRSYCDVVDSRKTAGSVVQ